MYIAERYTHLAYTTARRTGKRIRKSECADSGGAKYLGGFWGHAPPGKFWNREYLKRNFLGFPGNFEVLEHECRLFWNLYPGRCYDFLCHYRTPPPPFLTGFGQIRKLALVRHGEDSSPPVHSVAPPLCADKLNLVFSYILGRLLRPDIVHFYFTCLGYKNFYGN